MVDFVDAAAGLTGPSTLLVAMKGQRAGLETECAELPSHYEVEIEALQVPFLAAQRHLVIVRHADASPSPDARQAGATSPAPSSSPTRAFSAGLTSPGPVRDAPPRSA
jgi:hypothetical protein